MDCKQDEFQTQKYAEMKLQMNCFPDNTHNPTERKSGEEIST